MAVYSYPAKAGYYDKNELSHLSSCVGFPGYFLAEGLESAPSPQLQSAYQRLSSNKPVSDRVIQDLLKSKHLHKKLEKVFNKCPADYNRKVFVKAMSLLKHRRLSFSEITDTRISFDLYMSEDGGGMFADTNIVLQALKMLDRAMSPLRLESEIQKQQAVVDFPPRIQLYEFMDLVVKSVRCSEVEKEMASLTSESTSYLSGSDSNDVLDFHKILMTKNERLLAHLDQQYKDTLYKKVEDPIPPIADTTTTPARTVPTSPRERATADSQRQTLALTPSLQYSQHRLLMARNGRVVFSPEQHQAVELSYTLSSRASTRCGTRYGTHMQNSPTQQRIASQANSRCTSRTPVLPRPATRDNGHHSSCNTFLTKSKSVPLLPSLHGHADKRDSPEMVVEDLTETISKVCEKSVYNASSALRRSMASVSQLNKLREMEYSQDPEPIHRDSRCGAREVVRVERNKRATEPIVTKLDISRHQGLIYDLEWMELRKKWQDPANKLRPRSRT